MLYDDRRRYRLTGTDRAGKDAREVVARLVVFLHTNREYEWPSSSGLGPALWLVAATLSLGYARRVQQRRFESHGDIDVWPFLRRGDLDDALTDPTYLRSAISEPPSAGGFN
jgi:hypothetical protein